MMNFIEIAKKRYSVRNYSSKKVEKEKLDKILQAAHVAPTAANLQPVHLIAVESKEGLEKISKGANIYNAPLAIIVCADHNKAWVRPALPPQMLFAYCSAQERIKMQGSVPVFLCAPARRPPEK